MTDQELVPDCISYTAAISSCHKNSLWLMALDFLWEMQQFSISADTFAHNSAISACAKAGSWASAFWILEEMMYLKLSPDLVTFSAVTSACQKGQQWERALALVFSDMSRFDVVPSIVTYSALISALGRGGQWTRALAIYHNMRDVNLNQVFCGAMITACGLSNAWEEALHFLFQMPALRVSRNEVTYNAAVGALDGTPHWPLAVLLLEKMTLEANPVTASSTSYNAVMACCSKAQAWEVAVHLLAGFEPPQGSLSDASWAAAISAYHQGSKWKEALDLAAQIPAGPKSCGALLAACGARWHLLVALLQSMLSQDIAMDSSHFQAGINACRSWQWTGMAKVEVGLASFNIALTTFGSAQWDIALACLQRIPEPDSINFATVVLAMGEASQWQQTLGLLELDDLDVSVANAAITACDKGSQWRQALLIFQQLLDGWKADDSWQQKSIQKMCC
eukprot:Skav221292  [mRNA]  locus=scaffold2775:281968:283553:+ [translate_table: standard]